MDKPFISYHIEERSFVAFIKREIHNEAMHGKFTDTQKGHIDIIVAELTSNLVKHANGGELLYRIFDEGDDSIFEIISIDKGPGIADVAKAKTDGVSTTQTLGNGLGAIDRLSSLSQLYSLPGWGTILYSKVTTKNEGFIRRLGVDLDIRAICVNKPREVVCGDGYRIKRSNSEIQIFFGDGLGHGEYAKQAVDKAGDFFMQCEESDPIDILRQMHEKVRRTRGLVASVAVLNKKTNEWKIGGVGNIAVRLYNGIIYRNYMAYNGTIGLNIPNSMKSTPYTVEKNQHLVMCSDGVRTRWDVTKYPSIFKYDNMIMAASIYKDFTRGTDDSSILIAKVNMV